MTKPPKPKRKGWEKKPREKKKPEEKRPAQTCKECGRTYHPKPDSKSDTCMICQHNLHFDVSENGVITQSPPEPKPSPDNSGPKICDGCGEEFPSEGFHNRYCDTCRRNRINVSIFAEPFSQGNYSRTDD